MMNSKDHNMPILSHILFKKKFAVNQITSA